MASSYALPTSPLAQHHQHGPDDACSHSQSQSHSHSHSHSHAHSHTSSLASLSPSRSRRESRPNGAHSHSRSHHQHDTNQNQYRANSTIGIQKDIPPPLASSGQWKMESTPGGTSLLSPTAASFDAAGVYEPPAASRPRAHSHAHHHHDHGVKRSKFTALLLRYTPAFPLLHAVVVEKDSRRIFYFMRLVQCSCHVG
jgi:zinc transporter 5/7